MTEETTTPTFKISPAVRKQIPGLFGFWGFSDSGKTFSALRFARGLVGPRGKIVLADTENERANLYAGKFGGWEHLDFQPPYTPERYRAALDDAIRANAAALIVDSFSHVWEGEGGVLDMADAIKIEGLGKWNKPKMSFKRMANAMFRAPIPIIFCLRAKDKNIQVGRGKEAKIVPVGEVPICESRFVYEMTVSAHLEVGTHKILSPIKAPEDISGILSPGEYINEEMGQKIAAWLAGGFPTDQEKEKLYREARDIATLGTARLKQHWDTLGQDGKRKLKPLLDDLKNVATQADAENGIGTPTPPKAPDVAFLDDNPNLPVPEDETNKGAQGT